MKLRFLLGGLICSLLLVACGDDDEPTPAATSSAAPASPTSARTPGPTASPATTPNVNPTPRDDQVPPFLPETTVTQRQGAATTNTPLLKDVRIGRNSGYDRIVFEFDGTVVPGYEVRYVQAAQQCGSGSPVTTAGPSQMTVTIRPAAAHDDSGRVTFAPRELPGFESIKQAKATCDFEGVVGWVIGGERKPFRVVELQNPPRIAVDIRQ